MTGKPTVYHGQSDVARWCGVGRAAVSNWMSATEPTRGWLPERRPEWEAFAANRSRGASPVTATRAARTAALIEAGVKNGTIDPLEAVTLLRELIGRPPAPEDQP